MTRLFIIFAALGLNAVLPFEAALFFTYSFSIPIARTVWAPMLSGPARDIPMLVNGSGTLASAAAFATRPKLLSSLVDSTCYDNRPLMNLISLS